MIPRPRRVMAAARRLSRFYSKRLRVKFVCATIIATLLAPLAFKCEPGFRRR